MVQLLNKTVYLLGFSIYLGIACIRFFHFLFYLKRKSTVYILDIDNTFANTWPTLIPPLISNNEVCRLRKLEVLQGSKVFFDETILEKSEMVIYLSVRPFRFHKLTLKWLKNNGLWKSGFLLLLVPRVKTKLMFIKMLSYFGYLVVYMDDLSYNEEMGSVQFYNNIIAEVKKMKITYIGYEKIRQLNNNF